MANKSKLNELVHKRNIGLPDYHSFSNDDGFICKLKLGEEIFWSEKAHSRKKAAEDDVAAVAILHFTAKYNTIDKTSHPITTTDDHHIKKQEQQVTTEQGSLVTRTATTENRIENTKEIPLNMFYPACQRTGEKPSEELQDYCVSRGWTEPIYHLKVKSKESTCGVFVNKVLYSFNETYPSDEEAKQESAKRVLAMLAKAADQLEDARKGITVIIPATKRSHPVTAKLVEPAKNAPVSSTKHTPVASAEEITSAIAKLTVSTETDAKPVDEKSTKTKQTTSSGTSANIADDRTTKAKQTTTSSEVDTKPTNDNIKPTGSDKNTLQQICQKRGLIAEYTTEYPPEEVGYITKLTVDGKTFTSSVHSSKKVAEAAAARKAIDYLTTNFSEPTTNSTMPKLPDMAVSYKNLLQEYCQKQKIPLPSFSTMASADISGFVSTVSIKLTDGSSTRFEGSPHPSKKAAEQNAAAIACKSLNLVP